MGEHLEVILNCADFVAINQADMYVANYIFVIVMWFYI